MQTTTGLTTENFISITGIIVTFIGFVFIYWQINEMKKQREQNQAEVKVSNAINIANRFQQLINNEIGFIVNALGKSEYQDVINTISDTELVIFDSVEWKSLCKNHPKLNNYINIFSDAEEIKKNMSNIANAYMKPETLEPQTFFILNKLISCNWELSDEELEIIKFGSPKTNTQKDISQYQAAVTKQLQIEFYQNLFINLFKSKTIDLLNKLEAITMELNTGLADEDTVYQSLHQLYIKTVKFLYPVICNCNCDSTTADKYYTNVIELYGKWAKKNQDDNKKDTDSRSIKTNVKY